MQSYLVVFDVPGIKNYVFGTDPLVEIRGASSRLVWLNCERMAAVLVDQLGSSNVYEVFANGGTAQFRIHGGDVDQVNTACEAVAGEFRRQSGDELQLLWGLAEFGDDYSLAVQQAHHNLRQMRDSGRTVFAASTFPLLAECASSSDRPASERSRRDALFGGEDEERLVSKSTVLKQKPTSRGLWDDWMQFLTGRHPQMFVEGNRAGELRCRDFADLVQDRDGRSERLGLVYADGNAMGQLVRDLDSIETCRAFSSLVDQSIRGACHQALEEVCDIDLRQIEHSRHGQIRADILLLGGDDLLVALPAERALPFAERAATLFREETERRIERCDGEAGEFFQRRGCRHLTISCGVIVGSYSYPFAMLLETVEELLASAKRTGAELAKEGLPVPACIDFHLIAGSAGQSLQQIRRDDFCLGSCHHRTLRPFTLGGLTGLHTAVEILRSCTPTFPKSRLHGFREAALEQHPATARLACRELFSRCSRSQRSALWSAMEVFGQVVDFPWIRSGNGGLATPLVDLVEGLELLEQGESA